MLHPAVARALATAHIEDLHRAAARTHTIRLARRVAGEPRVRSGARAGIDRASSEARPASSLTRTSTRSG